ncbi:MAG: hypothetical protein O7D88_03865 [Gammaproteobacteria bacterium]|nr:hypothetical protein [Gammaproteobacteria bacterium]
MSVEQFLSLTPSPVLSAIIWAVIIIAILYLARSTVHAALRSVGGIMHNALRLGSRSISRAEARLEDRNREVLLATGREAKERVIEREFERVGDSVDKDLSKYPALRRRLNEAIARIDEDHQSAIDVPPSPPGWTKAVEVVAKIDAPSDYMIGNILSDIHKSLVKAHNQAIEEYRKASAVRHKILTGMMPQWIKIQQTLSSVTKNIDSLLKRSRAIDRHMKEYEDIVKGTDRAVQTLSSSSLVQFFVSALILVVALGGATVNFSLIARPMAEMVGGTNFIGSFRTADIAALVIILVEISMGLFLMESMRITRLFPVIGALPDKMRVRMIYVTFTILFLLATVEAGLAYMREILLQDELATSAILRGDAALLAPNDFQWITTAAQMGMGFVLPFALVFVAIPLETFVHSMRTVVGVVGIGLLRTIALLMRVLGNTFRHGATFFQRLYDLLIIVPLWIEHMVVGKRNKSASQFREVSL